MQSRSVVFLPVGAMIISIIAILYPESLSAYGGAIVPMLGLVMFSMGMTLRPIDFKRVFKQPKLICIGVLLQFLLMPFIAWLLSIVLKLPLLIATGLILVGSCPGGTASNVICFLARANVALSISLTAISTLLAVVLTPLITYVYVDQTIDVPVLKMIKNLVFIIILPVLSGVLINTYFQQRLNYIKSYLPMVSVISIILIIGIIVAKNQAQVIESGYLIFTAIALHNLFGLISGYIIPRLMRIDEKNCRTIAIEVGMQNSGLAVVLANQYFSVIAALPGALFSIWHNITGAVLAVFWSRKNEK
ncbi:MAG: bile acid:sodium symporter family protein [Proteobacteria bacterium]|nr:bile acid:sodium symporter family protein [Pseudomonadota bacterium]